MQEVVAGIPTVEGTLHASALVRADRRATYSAGAHWILFASPVAAALAVLVIFAAVTLIAPGWAVLALMPLSVCLIMALRLVPTYMRFRISVNPTRVAVRTDRHGIVGLELGGMKSLKVRQSPVGKALGYGDVAIRHSQGYYLFRRVRDPIAFRRQVRDAVFAMQRAAAEAAASSEAAS